MRVLQIDSFTDQPFRGNPAAVVLLDEPRDADWMQSVAAEMNLAETAFLEAGDDPATFGLRWFTPTVEVDLCGHATLASAHALWETGTKAAPLRFTTRSGELTADRNGDEIVLDFPVDPPADVDSDAADQVARAIGTAPRWVGRGRDKYLVLLDNEDAVRKTDPDLAESADAGAKNRDTPAAGIDEDPVTGSAHCCLAPFWIDRFDRRPLLGYQASARGGFVGVDVDGDRVRLTGRTVTVLRGEIG